MQLDHDIVANLDDNYTVRFMAKKSELQVTVALGQGIEQSLSLVRGAILDSSSSDGNDVSPSQHELPTAQQQAVANQPEPSGDIEDNLTGAQQEEQAHADAVDDVDDMQALLNRARALINLSSQQDGAVTAVDEKDDAVDDKPL